MPRKRTPINVAPLKFSDLKGRDITELRGNLLDLDKVLQDTTAQNRSHNWIEQNMRRRGEVKAHQPGSCLAISNRAGSNYTFILYTSEDESRHTELFEVEIEIDLDAFENGVRVYRCQSGRLVPNARQAPLRDYDRTAIVGRRRKRRGA